MNLELKPVERAVNLLRTKSLNKQPCNSDMLQNVKRCHFCVKHSCHVSCQEVNATNFSYNSVRREARKLMCAKYWFSVRKLWNLQIIKHIPIIDLRYLKTNLFNFGNICCTVIIRDAT
jgi:hypothetical protein